MYKDIQDIYMNRSKSVQKKAWKNLRLSMLLTRSWLHWLWSLMHRGSIAPPRPSSASVHRALQKWWITNDISWAGLTPQYTLCLIDFHAAVPPPVTSTPHISPQPLPVKPTNITSVITLPRDGHVKCLIPCHNRITCFTQTLVKIKWRDLEH